MKTLDEVIAELEDEKVFADALHYLKEYRSDMKLWESDRKGFEAWIEQYKEARDKHQQAVIDMAKNPPLSWEELKTMEGKPVWVEALLYKQWAIIAYIGVDHIRFEGANLYAPECRVYMGADNGWQAYRKERNENAGRIIETMTLTCDVNSQYREQNADVLHYLKLYQSALKQMEANQQIIEDAVRQRDAHIKALAKLNRNEPLTWEELKTMEGKPVWVEVLSDEIDLSSRWMLVARETKAHSLPLAYTDDICYWFYGHEDKLGKVWKAYRKER